ncbi:MAG: OadG family protein [Clostridia bacterium]|nr:OadG family protein [Clostridia bacterium]
MINNLLALINQEGSLDFGEACIYGLIGFLVVFLGIVLIIVIIWLIGLLMRKTNNLEFLTKIGKKKKKKDEKSAVQESVAAEEEIPAEVKAAIIAAIMAYYTKEQPKCEFKVKRIKRI